MCIYTKKEKEKEKKKKLNDSAKQSEGLHSVQRTHISLKLQALTAADNQMAHNGALKTS